MPLSRTVGEWTIKTLSQWAEVEASLRLRHDVFHVEHHGRRLPAGVDVDEMDEHCDHLGVFDEHGRLQASYRLTATTFSRNFYAAKRFELDAFLTTPGIKVELGRACVAHGQRNGILLHLLWRGIVAYAEASGAQHLFGSASVRTTDMARAQAIYDALRAGGHCSDRYRVRVRAEARALNEGLSRMGGPTGLGAGPLPPLFASYLKAGAKIAGEPARDPYLGSVDFLAVLDLPAMSERFRRKYCGR